MMAISEDQVETGELDRMYQVAADDEVAVLDALAERAGLRWTCRDSPEHRFPWTNHAGEPCEQCGRSETEASDPTATSAPTTSEDRHER
jgi:hypothetical protein